MRDQHRFSCAAVALAVLGLTGDGASECFAGLVVLDEASRTASAPAPASGRAGVDGEGSASDTTLGRRRPISESVDRAVDELIRRHFSSCGRAEGDDVPCFPVSIERKWQYSVADSLQHLEFDDSPAPGRPPTLSEMSGARPGPRSASGSVSFDPVCKGRQLLKAITGRSRTYYLYRVWDADGEHAVLRDQPMAASEWSGAPRVHYVELGSFGDECEAIAAWRQALRETRARRESRGEDATAPAAEGDASAAGQAAEAGVPGPPP